MSRILPLSNTNWMPVIEAPDWACTVVYGGVKPGGYNALNPHRARYQAHEYSQLNGVIILREGGAIAQ